MSERTIDLRTGPGRPRAFDETETLCHAMRAFRTHGYAATSLDDLTRAMGISRSSFYATFGCKRNVLMAALEIYSRETVARLSAVHDDTGTPRASALLRQLVEPAGEPGGCLLINVVAELAPVDPEIAAFARCHFDRLTQLFADALAPGAPSPPRDRARALVAIGLGAILLRKAGMAPGLVDATLAEADPLIHPDRPVPS